MGPVGLSRNDQWYEVCQASLDTLFILILVVWSVEVKPNSGRLLSSEERVISKQSLQIAQSGC